ncbi:MAG: hypothetical protein QOG30_2001 [Acidimicrobiaceae bacterium]
MALSPAYLARVVWQALEPIHAVTYFSDESSEAYETAGLKGFWMGYFGGRAAPMGEVGPAAVEATFFNFHPDMVRRAIPDAWSYASAASLLDVRAAASAVTIRRLVPDVADVASTLLPLLQRAIDTGAAPGRALFAANRDVAAPVDPVSALWQATTTLREHRGDGHVSVLTSEGLDGCEAHVLFALVNDVPREVYQRSRGWTDDDWFAAAERLRDRGAGRDLHDRIEARTDELAAAPYAALSGGELEHVLDLAGRVSAAITGSGLYPYPNPIGLPPPQ